MGVNYTRQCAYAIRDNKMPANISKIYKISINCKDRYNKTMGLAFLPVPLLKSYNPKRLFVFILVGQPHVRLQDILSAAANRLRYIESTFCFTVFSQ